MTPHTYAHPGFEYMFVPFGGACPLPTMVWPAHKARAES